MTFDEFLQMRDEGHPYELVDGVPIDVTKSVLSGVIAGTVLYRLQPFAKGRGYLTCGKASFRIVNGNVRCPPISYTRRERVPDLDTPTVLLNYVPDLCIEIISPSEEPADMARKVREYFASGAKIVWQMFPESETIKVYTEPDDFTLYTAQDEIDCPDLLPGFRVPVAELFELE